MLSDWSNKMTKLDTTINFMIQCVFLFLFFPLSPAPSIQNDTAIMTQYWSDSVEIQWFALLFVKVRLHN